VIPPAAARVRSADGDEPARTQPVDSQPLVLRTAASSGEPTPAQASVTLDRRAPAMTIARSTVRHTSRGGLRPPASATSSFEDEATGLSGRTGKSTALHRDPMEMARRTTDRSGPVVFEAERSTVAVVTSNSVWTNTIDSPEKPARVMALPIARP